MAQKINKKPTKGAPAPLKKKAIGTPLSISASPVKQGKNTFYLFHLPASQLYAITEIDRRAEVKREGYQRNLSPSRVAAIARYIARGGILPGAIIVSFDSGQYDAKHSLLKLPGGDNIGWVIDGQHRLFGAYEASQKGLDIDLPVAAFLSAPIEEQIELFITINREARGVPASLYIDLLHNLPRQKTEKEITEERIADIARRLANDENTEFYQRITLLQTARPNQISLVNFARLLRPYLTRSTGILGVHSQFVQEGAIANYYKALAVSFPVAAKKGLFFKTIGFGGVWRAFPMVFNLTIAHYKEFTVAAIAKIFQKISGFDFEAWGQLGTGTAAEMQASADLVQELQSAFGEGTSSTITLKL